ncbi:hypothetical protein LOD99_2809 [Oopsacas minuta]|uniref:Uncharacterized protein n=1 Tax=Oopsacas minuta TaxID=111878 RepID=A0AAV7K1K3_9METZ|nr:hypothetical protein LOD99_2809 [Oopsacas minuta]
MHWEPSREISGDVKRFLDSRTAEERGQIYKYLQDTARGSRDDEVEKVTDDEAKTKLPKNPSKAKKEGSKEAVKGSEHSDADKKKQEAGDSVSSPRRHKYSEKYKRQRVNKAQSATGTIFSVSGARQPAHYAIFPDWPSEKDSKK